MSALGTRLDRLQAALKARTPPLRRYVRLIVDEADMATLPALQAKRLDELVAAGAFLEEQRDDIDWIVRVIVDPPIYPESATPPKYDARPLLRSITLPSDATDIPEPRKRKSPIEDRRMPLTYPRSNDNEL